MNDVIMTAVPYIIGIIVGLLLGRATKKPNPLSLADIIREAAKEAAVKAIRNGEAKDAMSILNDADFFISKIENK